MCSIHVAEEAAHTAEFIERMDQLFNAFNSQTLTSPALMPHALTETSGHKVVLLGILDLKQRQGWQYINFVRCCVNCIYS